MTFFFFILFFEYSNLYIYLYFSANQATTVATKNQNADEFVASPPHLRMKRIRMIKTIKKTKMIPNLRPRKFARLSEMKICKRKPKMQLKMNKTEEKGFKNANLNTIKSLKLMLSMIKKILESWF